MPLLNRLLKKFRERERGLMTLFVAIAVLLPTVLFLWFLAQALRIEGAARRSEMAEQHSQLIAEARHALDDHLDARAAFAEVPPGMAPSEQFRRVAEGGTLDSIVLLAADGRPHYPANTSFRRNDQLSALEKQALSLRSELRAQIGGGTRAGVEKLLPRLEVPELSSAADASGRHIIPGLQLLAAQQPGLAVPKRDALLAVLKSRVADYTAQPPLPSAQRLFIAEGITALDPSFTFATARAERLATQYLQHPLPLPAPGVLTRAESPADTWLLLSPDGAKLGIFTIERLWTELRGVVMKEFDEPGLGIRVRLSDGELPEDCVARDAAGRRLPDWDIQLFRIGDALDTAAARGRNRMLAIAAGALAIIGVVGFFAIRRFLMESHTTDLRHDFLSTVSHELKTPLTSIRLLVDTLHGGQWADPNRVRQYVEVMQREITRLSHLVESFLTYTRLERGRMQFEFLDTAPEDVAAHSVAIVEPKFKGHGHFTVEIDPDLPVLNADADTLTTAVLNLLDNAWKYSPDGRRIVFRVFAEKENVCFQVEDNGIGLSQRDVKRVLQRYYRVDSKATRGIGGAGLGLSIVKYVAEAHAGTVTIESELGKGSCFTLRIPIHHPETS